MRVRRREPKPLEQVASIGAWTEVIDGKAVAAVAVIRLTDRGGVYGAGTMLLVPTDHGRERARREVMRKLLDEVEKGVYYRWDRIMHHRYDLPLVEFVRDLNRA